MIPFKAVVSPISWETAGGGSGALSPQSPNCDPARRQKETREFRHFSICRVSEMSKRKQKQYVEYIEGEYDEEEFWSLSRIWDNVRLKGGIWHEISGALGDSGTFIPVVLALALVNGLDLGTCLVFTGIFNIGTGLLFGIPMPIQPMSAVVIAALTSIPTMTISQIMAAGMSTGIVLAILGITGLMSFFYRLIPTPVVRGVMLCEGLTTGFTAVQYILEKQDLTTMQSLGRRNWLGVNGLVLPILMLLFLVVVSGVGKSAGGEDEEGRGRNVEEFLGKESLLSRGSSESSSSSKYRDTAYEDEEGNWRRAVTTVPTALIILLVALTVAIARNPRALSNLQLGPSPLTLINISFEDWKTGFVRATVYQIPVSILSSVISVSRLSRDLFPGEKVTPNAVCISVGVMNLMGCFFGAMPVCHGAGGLAGQYRFGARSGLSMVLLGTAKIALGLVLGSSLLGILAQFPVALLGILLLSSGLELATVCRDQNSRRDALVMMAVAVVSIGASTAYNTLAGFVCGLVLYLVLKLHEWLDS